MPQGSILGPLLFLIYISDKVEDIHSCIRLFADDTSLYIIVDNPLQAAERLNEDLRKIHSWAAKWLVSFNPAKSESILFSRKLNRPFHPHLIMNQQVIDEETSHKHLGHIFSSDCNWYEHIGYVKTKAWSRIKVMRKLKFQLDKKSLETISFSFIRPLLEYASVVWNNCTQYESNELEKNNRTRLPVSSGVRRNLRLSIHCTLTWAGKVSRLEGKNISLYFIIRCNME